MGDFMGNKGFVLVELGEGKVGEVSGEELEKMREN